MMAVERDAWSQALELARDKYRAAGTRVELGGTRDSTPPLTCTNTVPPSTLSPRGLRSVPLGAASRRHSILARALLARRAADGEVLGVLVEPAGTPPEGLESEAGSTKGGTMRRFVIERDIPDIGSAEREQLRAAAGQSNAVLRAMQSEGKHIPVGAQLRGR